MSCLKGELDMSRIIGTVSRGLRCPIINQGDDLESIVIESVIEASKEGNFSIQDKDIVQ